ncbi:MAG: hypothetical protein AAGF92_01400 [Myxococcota bacterium]
MVRCPVLALHENGLETDAEWHALKDAVLVCRYGARDIARSAYQSLDAKLKATEVGLRIADFLATNDEAELDAAATLLTRRELGDAWIVVERL